VLLARRDQAIDCMRANASIRIKIPEGMEGAPGRKFHAVVLSCARPDRARIEVLSPLGQPAATILIADGQLQVFKPFDNELLQAPLSGPELSQHSPFPVPMAGLPALLRATSPLVEGKVAEVAAPTPVMVEGSAGKATVLEVRSGGELVQRVTVVSDGYPAEDQRLKAGSVTLRARFLQYGSAQAHAGPIAFPQEIAVDRPDGSGPSLDVTLTEVEVNPALGADAFTLTLDPAHPPRILPLE
jgi:hypothetical protein